MTERKTRGLEFQAFRFVKIAITIETTSSSKSGIGIPGEEIAINTQPTIMPMAAIRFFHVLAILYIQQLTATRIAPEKNVSPLAT